MSEETASNSTTGCKRVQALLSKKRYALLESGFKDILKERCMQGREDETLQMLLKHIQETMQFDPQASTYAARDARKLIDRQRERNASIKDIAKMLRSQLKEKNES